MLLRPSSVLTDNSICIPLPSFSAPLLLHSYDLLLVLSCSAPPLYRLLLSCHTTPSAAPPPPLLLCFGIAAFISPSASGPLVFMTLSVSEIYLKKLPGNSLNTIRKFDSSFCPEFSHRLHHRHAPVEAFSQKQNPQHPLGRSGSRTQTHEAQRRHQFALQAPRCSSSS